MSYLDIDYYNNYSGLITDSLDSKLNKASEQIDSLTFNKIVGIGFNNLASFSAERQLIALSGKAVNEL